MKITIAVVSITLFVTILGCPSLREYILGSPDQEKARLSSPSDGAVAVVLHKEKLGPPLPGPEPPKTLERWARLKVLRQGKMIYDSGYENLNIYQRGGFAALDLMWSPDSKHLAYRHITSFRIIDQDGKATAYAVTPEKVLISSFRWIDDDSLLIVSKTADHPLDMYGMPVNYTGYTDRARGIRITHLHLSKGKTERFQQDLASPTFLFHAIDFSLDEISPKADRVAFSDGVKLCIYDDAAKKLIARVSIPQKTAANPDLPADYPSDDAKLVAKLAAEPAQLEGIWWLTNDRLLLGVGLMGFPAKSFYTFDIPSQTFRDGTELLMPIWEGTEKARNYQDSRWYSSVIK